MPVEPTIRLTDEQIAEYKERGFLKLPCISTPEELEQLRAIYDRLFAARTGRERGDQFDLAGADEDGEQEKLPQILGPSNYAPEMKETLAWANAAQIIRQLLEGDDIGQGDHAILKPAGYGAPTPWHQDEAYWDPNYDHRSLSIWMPLQDTGIEAGCLHFVPGSHRGEVRPHQPIGNDPRVHGLELAQDLANEEIVAVPLLAGEVTVHSQRTLHYAPPNKSDTPRRAWILMGSRPGTKREEPYDYYWQKIQETARAERAAKA